MNIRAVPFVCLMAAPLMALGFSLFGQTEIERSLLPAAILGSTVVLIPFLLGGRRLSSHPVHAFGAIAVVLGGPVRALGMSLSERWRLFYFPNGDLSSGAAITFYFLALVALTLGLTMPGMVVAWTSGRARREVVGSFESDLRLGRLVGLEEGLTRRRFGPVLAVAAISLVAFVIYTRSVSGLSLTNFSLKPRVFLEVQSGESSGSFVALRLLNELTLALVVLFAAIRRGGHLGLQRWIFTLLLILVTLLGLSIPFVSSEREVIVSFAATLLLVRYRAQRLSVRQIIGTVVAVVLVFGVLTDLRSSRQDSLQFGVGPDFVVEAGESFLLNRNLADVSKTVLVVDAVPERLAVDNGRRQFGTVLGVIPRAFWPGKPVIGTGPEVSTALYSNPNNGIPPGLLAESYWSFEWYGLGLVFIVGVLAAQVEGRIVRSRTSFEFAVALWVGGPALLDALGVGLGYAVTSLVIRGLQVFLLYSVYRMFVPSSEIRRSAATSRR